MIAEDFPDRSAFEALNLELNMEGIRRYSHRLMTHDENNISISDMNKNKEIVDKNRRPLSSRITQPAYVTSFSRKKILVDEIDKKEIRAEIKSITIKTSFLRKDSSSLFPEEFEDIGHHLHYLEQVRALPANFMDGSVVTPRMRQILVDWMLTIYERFGLEHETFHLGVTLLDRSIGAMKNIKKTDLQLLAASCMFLASKYEEVSIPHIGDFVYMADNLYTAKDVVKTESQIFAACNFNINFPLAVTFLRRYRYYLDNTTKAHFYSKMIMDLAYFHSDLCSKLPSVIVMCANYLSYVLTGIDFPFDILASTGFKKSQLLRESSDFVDRVISFMTSKKECSLRKKYARLQISMDLTESQKQRLLALKSN